jgi:hypothetical protein
MVAAAGVACGSSGVTSAPAGGPPDAGLVTGDDAAPLFGDGGGGDDGGGSCQRKVSLTVVDLGTAPPFDVVLVADNSDSLSWSHADLVSGLQNLLGYVHGRDVRFFLLTTTQYGASSQNAISRMTGQDLVTWNSSITGAPYTGPVTQYSQTCTDGPGNAIACPAYPDYNPYNLHGSWAFTMPPPIAAITAAMTDAEIAVQQQAVSDAILGLGGGGSSEEQPICTLSRYIAQDSANLPKNVVFIVLSDEDDTTLSDHCLATYDYIATATSTVTECTSNCSYYDFEVSATPAETKLAYTCVPVDDKGNAHPELGVPHTLGGEYTAVCSGAASGTCTSNDVTRAGNDCGSGYIVQNCTFTCGPSSTASTGCGLQRSSATPNLCTQSFVENGTTYKNLSDYCTQSFPQYAWGACMVAGFQTIDGGAQGYSQTERKTQLVPSAYAATDMIAQFRSKADAAFGASAYEVETIQLDPAFSCPVNPGQSYGRNLRTLATSSADVFPICGSYAPVLEHVQGFADKLLQTSYPLSLTPREVLQGVSVADKSGKVRALDGNKGDYVYDRAAAMLRIAAGVLTSNDASLQVSVTEGCAQ